MAYASHGHGRGHEVLLVDDEEIFLSSLFEGLCRRFPDVTFRTAHDGEAALDELGKRPVDLVITDLKMPRMDGFQLIAAMHSKYPRIPLLIMTAHSTEMSVSKAMASGALHCIDKPVDLSELSRRIDELFSTGAIASLRGVSLAAFLQLLGMERKSGIVDVQGEGKRARLFLSHGQVIHADDGTHSGLEAALRTVCLDDVEIQFRPGAVPKTPTIDLPLTQILLDAARLRDESERNAMQDLDLAFSESFSDAFDERLSALEAKEEPAAEPGSSEAAATAGLAAAGPAVAGAAAPASGPSEGSEASTPSAPLAVSIPQAGPSSPRGPATALPIPPRSRPGTMPPRAVPAAPSSAGAGPSAAGNASAAAAPAGRGQTAQPPTTRMVGLRTSGSSGGGGSVTRPLASVGGAPSPAPAGAGNASSGGAAARGPGGAATPRTALAGAAAAPLGQPAAPTPGGARSTPHAAANLSEAVVASLRKVAEISGVLGAAFVDFHSGEVLGAVTRDRSFDTVTIARSNVEVVRAELALVESQGGHDAIEDIVITTAAQYHVLCMSERRPQQFLFVAMSRDQATLALARFLIDEAVHSAGGSTS